MFLGEGSDICQLMHFLAQKCKEYDLNYILIESIFFNFTCL